MFNDTSRYRFIGKEEILGRCILTRIFAGLELHFAGPFWRAIYVRGMIMTDSLKNIILGILYVLMRKKSEE